MGFITAGMGDHLSALLVSLMPLQLALVDRNPVQPCFQFMSAEGCFTFIIHHFVFYGFKISMFKETL